MRSLRFHIAVSLVFVLLPFTEAGIIKNFFTNLAGGKNQAVQNQPTGYSENEQRTPGHNTNDWNTNDDYRSSGSKPNSQYGAAGTYTKKPVIVDGTTEKYKNTSWYIENEEYLSPNKNEQKQQRPNSQYGAAGTYTIKPPSATTEKFPGKGNHLITSGNEQQKPTGLGNSNKNQTPVQENIGDGFLKSKETTRSSVPVVSEKLKSEDETGTRKVVLQTDGVTCCYSNLQDKIENRNLHCNKIDCHLDKVYEKSSLWVCDTMKCTVASVDFSLDQGSKKLLECSDGRNIITVQDKPLNCGPNEKEHNGKCRKVFGGAKSSCWC